MVVKTPVIHGTQTFVADIKLTPKDDTIGFLVIPSVKFTREVYTKETKFDKYDETFYADCDDSEAIESFAGDYEFVNEADEDYFTKYPSEIFNSELVNERLQVVSWGDVDFEYSEEEYEVAC